jgi:hypothetical protein
MDILDMTLNYITPKKFNDDRQRARNSLDAIYENKVCVYRIQINKNNIKEAFGPPRAG